MSIDQTDNGKMILRLSWGEAASIVAVLVAVLSALNGWFVLPNEVRRHGEEIAKHERRMVEIERVARDKGEILATTAATVEQINERTKRIEEKL